MEKEKRYVGREIHKLHHAISRYLAIYMKEAGIDEVTMMHGWIIRYLYDNCEKDIFQKDIEKTFSIGKSTVTNIIQAMEKKGYIRRESVEYDARLKKVVLTEKGIKNNKNIETMFSRMNQMIEENIDEKEKENFFLVTDKITENLKIQRAECKKGGIVCFEPFCEK